MTIGRIFYGYMTLIGVAAEIALTMAPWLDGYFIKPYFWILIAVAVFEISVALYGRIGLATVLTMGTRIIGFGIGIVLMAGIPLLAGTSPRFM